MQPYDLFMLVVLIGATAFGAMKGMAWQAASLGSIVLSYFVALNFSGPIAHLFHQQAPWNKFLAMAALYVLTSLAVWLVFRVVAGAIDRVKLKSFDRQMGALIGAFKGALLCLAITLFAVGLSANARDAVLKSRSGVYISQLLNRTEHVIPAELHEVLDPYLNRLERGLDPSQPGPMSARTDQNSPATGFGDAVGRQVRDTFSRAAEDTWRQFESAPRESYREPTGRGSVADMPRDGFGQPYRPEPGYRDPSSYQTPSNWFGGSDDANRPAAAVSRSTWNQTGSARPSSRYSDEEDARDAAADRPARR
jgi:membrane protein required for colicin V production